jgi:hypothetical protein
MGVQANTKSPSFSAAPMASSMYLAAAMIRVSESEQHAFQTGTFRLQLLGGKTHRRRVQRAKRVLHLVKPPRIKLTQ